MNKKPYPPPVVFLGLLTLAGWLFLAAGCATVTKISVTSYYPPQVPSHAEAKRFANIRVALVQNRSQVKITCEGPVKIYDMHTRNVLLSTRLSPDALALVRDNRIILDRQVLPSDRIRLVPGDPQHYLSVAGNAYRGQIEISLGREPGTLLVVNYVPLEEYLLGVVPNEVPYQWPLEALKAQAVAARTFALYKMSGRADDPYDLDASMYSQVYRGLGSERDSTTRAVSLTRQIIAVYQGRFIAAFYHSNCGGQTADVREVWGGNIDYLEGTACGFCQDGPHFSWQVTLSDQEIARALTQHNVAVRGLLGLKISGYHSDGRAREIIVRQAGGETRVPASIFRMALGPDKIKSTIFQVRQAGRDFIFAGKGWGHGVGLCQEGALGMAQAGYGFEDILKHYYPGIEIRRLELP